jgi:drug/metabolite transporter (DMT)-like permease
MPNLPRALLSFVLVMFACATLFSGATLLVLRVPAANLARAVGAPHVGWTALYTALFCSVIAIAVLNRCQREISATRAAVLYLLEPLFAALFARLFMGEELTARKLLGGGIILVGNLVCELIGRRGQGNRLRRRPSS